MKKQYLISSTIITIFILISCSSQEKIASKTRDYSIEIDCGVVENTLKELATIPTGGDVNLSVYLGKSCIKKDISNKIAYFPVPLVFWQELSKRQDAYEMIWNEREYLFSKEELNILKDSLSSAIGFAEKIPQEWVLILKSWKPKKTWEPIVNFN